MAGEQKKPKIDLKSRIPSKTVKGLTPAPGGGAIPPPPGAVPAPPPDLLGRRAPQPTGDPNDPLGAATGGAAPAQPQIVVVQGAHEEGHAPAKGAVLYALIGGALVVGLGIGYVVGSAMKGSDIANKAKNDAKEIQAKVTKTNDNLQKLLDTLKAAQGEMANTQQLSQPTIDAIKGWQSGFGTGDLKGRELAYFGEDTMGKVLTYASKLSHIDDLRTGLTKGNGLENSNAQIKNFEIPKDHARWGVKISKPSDPKAPPITMADLVDFGAAVKLAPESFTGDKEKKLKVKSGELDVDPNPKDFFGKSIVSAIEGKDWLKACPVYAQAVGYTKQSIDELATAIEGAGDDRGTLQPGKELADKLKTLAK